MAREAAVPVLCVLVAAVGCGAAAARTVTVHSLLTTDVSAECIHLQWAVKTPSPPAATPDTTTSATVSDVQFQYWEASKQHVPPLTSALLPAATRQHRICELTADTHYVICVWLVRSASGDTPTRLNDTAGQRRNCVGAATATAENTAVYIGSSIGAVVFVILFMIFLCLIRIKCSMLLPKMLGRKGSAKVRARKAMAGSLRLGAVPPATADSGDEARVGECVTGPAATVASERGSCSSSEEENCALCHSECAAAAHEQQAAGVHGSPPAAAACALDMDRLVPGGIDTDHLPLRASNSAPAFHCLTRPHTDTDVPA